MTTAAAAAPANMAPRCSAGFATANRGDATARAALPSGMEIVGAGAAADSTPAPLTATAAAAGRSEGVSGCVGHLAR